MNMAKKSEHDYKPDWEPHAAQHAEGQKPGEKGGEQKPGGGGKGGGGGGGGSAPDDSWRKQSEPHPITPGKPAPQGPDQQKEGGGGGEKTGGGGSGEKATLISTKEESHFRIDSRAQTGGPMPAPALATGSTMARPYRNPIAPPIAGVTGPKNPPTAGAWPWQ